MTKLNSVLEDIKNKELDPDTFTLTNIKLGYTQGELQEDFEDYEDGFRAKSHIYWKFSILTDQDGQVDCPILLIDWNDQENSQCFELCIDDDDELVSLANHIGEICSATTDDMFGSTFPVEGFQAIVMEVLDLDEPEEYENIKNDILEQIGGEIYLEEETDNIPEENVNSLFVLSENIDPESLSFKDGKILINEKEFDIDADIESELMCAGFSEDIMNMC